MKERSGGRHRALCSNVRVEFSSFDEKREEAGTSLLPRVSSGKENEVPSIFELKSDDGTVIQVSERRRSELGIYYQSPFSNV